MTIRTRALPLVELTGRTIEGVAYRYELPSSVTDDGLEYYYEQMLRGCDTKTIRDRAGGAFPLLVWHSRTTNRGLLPPDEVGQVQFTPREASLDFRAVLNRSRLADELRELIADDTARDVSVSFKPLRPVEGVHDGRLLVSHAAISLRELSVAPTGTGQHAGAEILVMRAAGMPDLAAASATARLRLLDL